MKIYLIIDSNKIFAEKFYKELTNQALSETENFWDVLTRSKLELGKISDEINSKLKNLPKDSSILINAEAKTEDGYFQDQSIVELAFWLRCKHKIENPIVFYSFRSINQLLKERPENFILLSPGCYHLKFPFNKQEIDKIRDFKKLENLSSIKPFLKPKINLDKTRHTYANYSGMFLMMLLAELIWKPSDAVLDTNNLIYRDLSDFWNSLDFNLLDFYYNLSLGVTGDIKELGKLKIEAIQGKILLVDDLAIGWEPIISQMVYGTSNDPRIESLKIEPKKVNTIPVFDLNKTKTELKDKIKDFKPHLILLDLRLNDEKDKQDVETLGGFKLLKHIKSSSVLRGLPVIVITASSNAETIKKLIVAGAESVWTKPGIDEGLDSDKIVERYKSLVDLIREVYYPDFSPLQKFNGDYSVKGKVNFNNVRNLLLKKLELIKYRCSLYTTSELIDKIPTCLADFDIIYFDANALITGNRQVNFADLISDFCLLSLLTSNSSLDILTDKKRDGNGFEIKDNNELFIWENKKPIALPKVVVMNAIYDEIIKLAKVDLKDYDYFPHIKSDITVLSEVRASNALLILKELFNERKIRAELKQYKADFGLTNPKENVYADGFILDEIGTVLVTKQQKAYGFKSDCKVLFVCDEKGLSVKLDKFNDGNNLKRIKLFDFIEIMKKVEI